MESATPGTAIEDRPRDPWTRLTLVAAVAVLSCGPTMNSPLAPITIEGNLPFLSPLVAGAHSALTGDLSGRSISVFAADTAWTCHSSFMDGVEELSITVYDRIDAEQPLPAGDYPARLPNPDSSFGKQSFIYLTALPTDERYAAMGTVRISSNANGVVSGSFAATWQLSDGGTLDGAGGFEVPDCP